MKLRGGGWGRIAHRTGWWLGFFGTTLEALGEVGRHKVWVVELGGEAGAYGGKCDVTLLNGTMVASSHDVIVLQAKDTKLAVEVGLKWGVAVA